MRDKYTRFSKLIRVNDISHGRQNRDLNGLCQQPDSSRRQHDLGGTSRSTMTGPRAIIDT